MPIEPFKSEILQLADGSNMYWEASGNPKGKPALYLHGRPGSGLGPRYRQHFDPERYLILAIDQRGCGRSRPLITDPGYNLRSNTTGALLADISSPLCTAWQLHQRWSESQLVVVETEGHGGSVMANEFGKAIANFVPA
ncbi:MAG TPA: hypothetical protein VE641_20130 [Chthoniobacterales bacterium]|jgi:hypothetical protein|nr:hypothetical protein [Chthoniobacterales bacterium]